MPDRPAPYPPHRPLQRERLQASRDSCCIKRNAMAAVAIENSAASIWRDLTKTGHCDVREIRNIAAVSRYITKYATTEKTLDTWIAYGPGRPTLARQ